MLRQLQPQLTPSFVNLVSYTLTTLIVHRSVHLVDFERLAAYQETCLY